MELFDKRLEILEVIYKQTEENGYAPTVRELCKLVGLKSTSTVHGHIKKLREAGYLYKENTFPRTLVLTEKGLEKLNVEKKQSSKLDYKEYKIILAAKQCLKENRFVFMNEFEDIINKLMTKV